MTLDPTVLPGLLLLAAQLLALSTVGYIVARVALRQRDNRLALAQGLAIGPALWGLTVNFVLYALPGQAGAVAAWGIVLALGAGLAWRAPFQIRLPLHTAAGFAVATLVVFWAVLACRQLVSIVDAYLQLGLAASIRAGSFPPVFPWQPGEHAPYHYGVNLLVALLAPPFGPDPAFTTELIDTFVWTTFAMVLAATVLRYGSWLAVAVSCPLLLSLGLWTQVHYTAPPGIVEILLPAGIPSAGIRHSLAEVYWPSASTSWTTALEVSPPNIVKPSFALAYALALVVLEHASAKRRRHPAAHLALAFVVGFLGLVDEVIAVTVLALWMSMECLRLLRDWRRGGFKRNGDSAGYLRWKRVLGSFMGPSLATALLVVGGGLITSILTGSSPSGVSLAWIADAGSRRPIADLAVLTGGVGVLAVGTIPVAAAAIAIGRRDSLVMLLAIASAVLLLAAFTLRYEFSTSDIARLDGHARNFALAALLVGLGIRLPDLRPRWRYTVAAFTIAAVTWPTAIGPVQNVRAAISRGGVEFKNAQLIASGAPGRESSRQSSRHRMPDSMAPGIAAYVREQTPLDTRILSPSPSQMSILTGRANAAGFLGTVQFHPTQGPEYRDAIRFLEPLALWKLGIDFIHAPDAWVGGLPHRAQQWLQNPELFEPLISEDAETLFRVLPAFYDLKSTPQIPESFEALRRSVPTASTVYFSAVLEPAEAHTRCHGARAYPAPGKAVASVLAQPA